MKIDELKNYYKTWSNICREFGMGLNATQYWRKIGYIPYRTQLLIEKQSKGKFKANTEHAKGE